MSDVERAAQVAQSLSVVVPVYRAGAALESTVREVLEAIYEQDFLDCSYGFRPGRSAHDAVRTLNRVVHRGEVSWILEADIQSFFEHQIRHFINCRSVNRLNHGFSFYITK